MSTPFSSLSSKAPQDPSATTEYTQTSSSSSSAGLGFSASASASGGANATKQTVHTTTMKSSTGPQEEEGQSGEGEGVVEEGWRPKINRTQSWNEQDMKRKYQERFLTPTEEKKDGFSET
ncbi:hypothetical protein MMC25_007604 [Agyrium rufum]|nr:hypothetical protein [Agyrium rufum]